MTLPITRKLFLTLVIFLGLASPAFAAPNTLPNSKQKPTTAIITGPTISTHRLSSEELAKVVSSEIVNPMTIDDDDFERTRDASIWRGLEVRRISFTENGAHWALWRVVNTKRPAGPLWLQLHDNENAPFLGAIDGIKKYGGIAVIVDTGPRDDGSASRFNRDVAYGPRIDPNRNFWGPSIYTSAILADLNNSRGENRVIISIHSNSPSFDSRNSTCGIGNGRGEISILVCNDTMFPMPSRSKRYPFDDDDSLAIIPFLGRWQDKMAFCARSLMKADFNIGFEKIVTSDGSLSNYAIFSDLDYINLETQDRGGGEYELADARARIHTMVDGVMRLCAD
ncbi:MAG: hypothetical protein FD163_2035 [Hyphomonadaceae bacterium]|nr:MAG: hypothetical protein FD163_2035 [Hyphomonadaceae bacterium]